VGASSPFKRKNYFKMEINKKEMGPNNNKNDQLIKVGKKYWTKMKWISF
jgi:hypothetical protein